MTLSHRWLLQVGRWACSFLLILATAGDLPAATPLTLDSIAPDAYPDDILGELDPSSDKNCGIVITTRQDYPRLMLSTRGPTATVRTLAFSPDSTRIYAAGLDKKVHAWGIRTAARAIRRTTVNTAVLVQSLHWEITRGPRGAIYDIAASPVNRELAIAGYSARDATGDIVVYDTATNTVLRALQGHRQAVASLTYSPDGTRLASVSHDGEVRLWSQADNWQSQILRAAGSVSTQFQPLEFLDNTTLAVSVPADATGQAWQIALYDVTAPQAEPRLLSQKHTQRITCLAADRQSQRWASADWQGNVFLWESTQPGEPKLLRNQGMALCMDFAPNDVLFVATALTQGGSDGNRTAQSTLEMWNTQTGQMIDRVETSKTEHNFICGVSPDGSRVVTYAGDDTQLLVFLLKDRTGPLDKPLSQKPLRLGGSGDKRYHVAFEKDSYRVGFSSSPTTPIEKVFDLQDPKLLTTDPMTMQWQSKDSHANGWELRVVQGNRNQLRLYQAGQPKGTINLDPNTHGNAKTYCWLAKDGETYGIAIGTDVQNGIFVFGAVQDGACPLLRYFRDHSDFVSSLSCSSDGKYLASCSGDQTVKIWSLEGVNAQDAGFAKAPGWGARFTLERNRVVIGGVLDAGTAARKGLRNGDVIIEATFGPTVAKLLGIGEENLTTGDPNVIYDALQQCPLTENVLLTIDRLGSRLNHKVLMIPAWEPLATLFVNQENEWALWTPQGYFDSSVEGDELFGWLVNKGVTQRAEFFRADQFRFELERPEVLRKLLTVGSVPAALRESKHPIPEDTNRVVDATVQTKPVVSILNPVDGAELENNVVKVRAVVDFPTVNAAERIEGSAFVNGVPGKVVDSQATGLRKTYEWDVPLSDVYNRLRVVAEDKSPDRMVNFSDVHFRLRSDRTPSGNPKLHLLTIAATDYQNVAKLELSITDATAIAEALSKQSGMLYETGEIVSLHNEQATRSNFYQTVQKLVEELTDTRPDDLLVVFLAGHGIAINDEYYFVPVDAQRDNIQKVGISWTDIRRLALIPCRKLVLLDTCHSGSVLPLHEVGANNWKAAIRPLKLDEFLVLSATDVGQEALEFGEHGIFTQCILEALQGKAAPGDRDIIYLNDVVEYVESEVPKRTASLQLQTPRSSPPELFNLISVPLTALSEK